MPRGEAPRQLLWQIKFGGPERARTAYLLIANEAFYQMNYGPESKIYNFQFCNFQIILDKSLKIKQNIGPKGLWYSSNTWPWHG